MKFSAVALLPLLAAASGDSVHNPPAPDAAAEARQLGDGQDAVEPSHYGGYYPKPHPYHPPHHPPHHKKHPKHDDDGVKKIFATKAISFGETKQMLQVGPFTVEASCDVAGRLIEKPRIRPPIKPIKPKPRPIPPKIKPRPIQPVPIDKIKRRGPPLRRLADSEQTDSPEERELFGGYQISLRLEISGDPSGYRRLTGDWHKHSPPIAVFGQGSDGSGPFVAKIDHDGIYPVDPIWSLSGGSDDATGNDDGTGAAYTSNGDYLGWSGEECIGRYVTDRAEDFQDFQAFAEKKEKDDINCVVACVFKYKEGGQPKKKHTW